MVRMQPPPAPSPEPGERRRLDHPPSDRYGTAPAAGAQEATDEDPNDARSRVVSPQERLLRGVAVGLAGAIVITILGGPLSITTGLVGAAGAIGWIVGAVMRPLRAQAVAVAVAFVALGLIGIWIFAGFEGGVLGPIEYLMDVQGILVPIELIVAGGLAAIAAAARAD
jgi:hypothetical protein